MSNLFGIQIVEWKFEVNGLTLPPPKPRPCKRVQVEAKRVKKVNPTALELKIPVVGLQGHFAIQNLLALLKPDWEAQVIEEDKCEAQPEYVLYTIQLLRRSEVE